MRGPSDDDGEGPANSRSAALIGIVVILVLSILAVVLIQELGRQSKLGDCLMSGRTNCAPIEVPPRQ